MIWLIQFPRISIVETYVEKIKKYSIQLCSAKWTCVAPEEVFGKKLLN